MALQTPLERAIELLGGQLKLAAAIGVKQQNIWYLLHKAKQVPAEYCPKIEAATNGKVTRHDLRPDLWPRGYCTGPKPAGSAKARGTA